MKNFLLAFIRAMKARFTDTCSIRGRISFNFGFSHNMKLDRVRTVTANMLYAQDTVKHSS
jgi:hypothetical protein